MDTRTSTTKHVNWPDTKHYTLRLIINVPTWDCLFAVDDFFVLARSYRPLSALVFRKFAALWTIKENKRTQLDTPKRPGGSFERNYRSSCRIVSFSAQLTHTHTKQTLFIAWNFRDRLWYGTQEKRVTRERASRRNARNQRVFPRLATECRLHVCSRNDINLNPVTR